MIDRIGSSEFFVVSINLTESRKAHCHSNKISVHKTSGAPCRACPTHRRYITCSFGNLVPLLGGRYPIQVSTAFVGYVKALESAHTQGDSFRARKKTMTNDNFTQRHTQTVSVESKKRLTSRHAANRCAAVYYSVNRCPVFSLAIRLFYANRT